MAAELPMFQDGGCGDDELFARVYSELKKLAQRQMSGERADHTLQATALVSEVWLRLRDQVDEARDNPGRFYLAAAESMRRILIEHARSRGRQKRGGDMKKLTLDLVQVADSANLDRSRCPLSSSTGARSTQTPKVPG